MTERSAEDRNLDVLRAIAVLLVLFGHIAVFSIARPADMDTLDLLANAGVIIFFVHTSLVLMRSLERTAVRGLRGWVRARDFYVRRAFRIYPLAIVTVLAVVGMHLPRMPRDLVFSPPTRAELVANLLLLQNSLGGRTVLGPLWSLPHEIEMYVVLPILFVLVRRAGRRRLALLIATALVLSALYVFASSGLPGLWRLSVIRYVPCFVAGVVAFRASDMLRPKIPAWAWPPIVLSTVIGSALVFSKDVGTYPRNWLVAIVVAAFIPLVRELPISLLTRAAHQVAKYSYGIYLSHIPVLDVAVVFMRGDPLWLRIGVAATGIVLLPLVLYHAIEEPMIKLGTRLAARLSDRHVSAPTLASTAPVP